MLASQILCSTDCEIASPLRQAETRTVYWAGAKLGLLGPRSDCVCERERTGWCIEKVVCWLRGWNQTTINQFLTTQKEKERSLAPRAKLFSILSRAQTAHTSFCLYPRSLTSPPSEFRTPLQQARIVRAWTHIERQMRLEISAAHQSCWHFLRRIKRARVFFLPIGRTCELWPSSKRPGDLFVWQMIRLETQMRLCGPHEITADARSERTTAFILHGQKPFYADLNPHLFNQAALVQTHINSLFVGRSKEPYAAIAGRFFILPSNSRGAKSRSKIPKVRLAWIPSIAS